MRITFVTPAGEVGGAERAMLGLLGALHRENDVSLVMMSQGPLHDVVVDLGICVKTARMPDDWSALGEQQLGLQAIASFASAPHRAFQLVRYARQLRLLFSGLKPEILHTHGIKAHLISATAKPRGCKLVWHVQDFLSRRRWSRKLLGFVAKRADLAIACSESVGADVRMCFPKLPVVVIPNCTDCGFFKPGASSLDLDAAAGLPPASGDVVRVGLVATYAIWKGHRLFLDALRYVIDQIGPDGVRAYIIGGPIYRTKGGSQVSQAELRTRIRELKLEGLVGLVPFQPDPADAYRALDVFVHASTAPEPFGLTITEAMACGRAVVAAGAGGPLEIITHEHDGLLYEPCDVEALTAAILRLVRDAKLRARLGGAARATVVSRFQLPSAVASLTSAYRELLGGRDAAAS